MQLLNTPIFKLHIYHTNIYVYILQIPKIQPQTRTS